MKIKEVYDRIGVSEARMPILEYLPNNSDILNLVEIWDGGLTEGHLLIQKNKEKYIIYEIIHHFNAQRATIDTYTIQDNSSIASIVNEIEVYCKNRYEGALNFNFSKISQDKAVCAFFGF